MEEIAFVFNDDSIVNSYGFRVLTKGICLKRFKKNPICLNQHRNDTSNVLGRWKRIKKNDTTLTGEIVLDKETTDEKLREIVRKVESGTLKSCSMGLLFNRADLKYIEGEYVLTKSELTEVSIVAVPSNSNSVVLYAEGSEELMSEQDIKNIVLELKNNNKKMEKINLSVDALAILGLQSDSTAGQINIAIANLKLKLDSANKKVSDYETKELDAKNQAITDMVDLAIKEGRISGEEREIYIELGETNSELLKKTLASFDKKAKFSVDKNKPVEMTKDEFQKLSVEKQLEYKSNNPQGYKEMLNNKK